MDKYRALNHIVRLSIKNADNCTIEGIRDYYISLGHGIAYQYADKIEVLQETAENIAKKLNTAFNNNEKPSYYLTYLFNGLKYASMQYLDIHIKAELLY
jgi:hypothetical protein